MENNCDVVVAMTDTSKQHREEFKSLVNGNIIEIYVHNNRKKTKDLPKVEGYEPPTENFVDVDTTNVIEQITIGQITQKIYEYKQK